MKIGVACQRFEKQGRPIWPTAPSCYEDCCTQGTAYTLLLAPLGGMFQLGIYAAAKRSDGTEGHERASVWGYRRAPLGCHSRATRFCHRRALRAATRRAR
eukprot:6212710-Pleurochrysis_carterae.AAC.6